MAYIILRKNIFYSFKINIRYRSLSILNSQYKKQSRLICTEHLLKLASHRRSFSLDSSIQSLVATQQKIFTTLSDSRPVGIAQDYFINLHDLLGLPWGATIILLTIMTRLMTTIPLSLYQSYIIAKVENLSLEMANIVKELNKETAVAIKKFKLSEKQAKILYKISLKKQWKKLIIRDNCHPFKATLLLWVQIPMWVCLSVSLRNLVYMLPLADTKAQIIFSQLSIGGFGWIPNLTMVDNSLILPFMLGAINLMIIEIHTLSRTKEKTKTQKYITNFFRFISIGMIPVAACVPACLSLYWVTSSAFGLIQNIILLSPAVKRFCCIPKTKSEPDYPYKHLIQGFKIKFRI